MAGFLIAGGALSAAVAAGCGYSAVQAFKQSKAIASDKTAMQSNVVTTAPDSAFARNFTKAPQGQRVILQHDVPADSKSFVLDLSAQGIKQDTKLVPYQDVSVAVDPIAMLGNMVDLAERLADRADDRDDADDFWDQKEG